VSKNAYIISAKRSIVAPIGGAFNALELHEIAAPVIRSVLANTDIDPAHVNELILSNALYGGGNPARVASLAAGLPQSVAGLSIDRQCVGGLDAILVAAQMIQSGAANVIVAGGAESYSRRPIRQKTFADNRPAEPYERAPFTPWLDRDPDMHVAAGNLSQTHNISKQNQDAWAIHSHAKALEYVDALQSEIVTIDGITENTDPYTRKLSQALCNRAKPLSGSVTSATTAVAADAAAFCIVVSEDILAALPNAKAVKIERGVTIGSDPILPGLAPVAAIKAIGAQNQDFTHIEIMEAYAVQAIACVEQSGLNPTQVNQRGGALARGHPIGASGAVLAVRLYHDLMQTGGTGLAAIAAAGGLGTAIKFSA
jgi:acetyl-CoA C-acetyltransferase